MRAFAKVALTFLAAVLVVAALAVPAGAQSATPGASPAPGGSSLGVEITSEDGGASKTVLIILLLTIGSVAPAILLLMTSFTRYIVVLALTRNGLGLQGIPPTQVLIGLALFMTFFTMGPVFSKVNETAVQPALKGQIDTSEAIKRGFEPLRAYMLEHTDARDLKMFAGARAGAAAKPRAGNAPAAPATPEAGEPKRKADVPASALIPAFAISELRRAFLIGFIIFVPFLVVDLVVSATLTALGMVMLPPVVISLPLKLLLFVLVDGWGLIVRSLMAGG